MLAKYAKPGVTQRAPGVGSTRFQPICGTRTERRRPGGDPCPQRIDDAEPVQLVHRGAEGPDAGEQQPRSVGDLIGALDQHRTGANALDGGDHRSEVSDAGAHDVNRA